MVVALPGWNSTGILIGFYVAAFGTTGFVIALAWLQSSTAGHTKKTTAMGLNLCGYCVGNIIGTLLSSFSLRPRALTTDFNSFVRPSSVATPIVSCDSFAGPLSPLPFANLLLMPYSAPRNYVPWGIMIACYLTCPAILLWIRHIYIKENKSRDALQQLEKDEGRIPEDELVEVKHTDGTLTLERIDKSFMDLTDKENKDFRWVFQQRRGSSACRKLTQIFSALLDTAFEFYSRGCR